jgi:hypothetical protein
MAVATPPPTKNRQAPPPAAGVIREARRRRRLRVVAQSAVLAFLFIAGTTIGVVSLGEGDPASSRQPRPDAVGRSDPAEAPVRLSPSLDGGTYGWCVGLQQGRGGLSGGGCGALPVRSRPIVMTLGTGSAKSRSYSLFVLSTPAVASLLVNGSRRVLTSAVPGRAYGMRAARIALPVHLIRAPSGRWGLTAPPEPRLVALAKDGRPIPNPPPGPRRALNLAAEGPCTLSGSGLPGLSRQWSHVAAAIRPYPEALTGRAFFSCVDVEYYLHGWPLDAAVLLDAAHPGSAPAPIPGLWPMAGHDGVFNGPGDFKGELTATRFGNAWLVVAGGSGSAQRLALLSHLKATISIPAT